MASSPGEDPGGNDPANFTFLSYSNSTMKSNSTSNYQMDSVITDPCLQLAQMKPYQQELENIADYINVMQTSKNETKLLQACGRLTQILEDDDFDEPLEEEIIRVTYQVMINHPLNSNLMQSTCELLWRCNQKPGFRDIIEEYAVFRPILSAIKNHKDDPYFLGTAMHALASLAESALSCKGLRQSQAYLDIITILELEDKKYDVHIQSGGLLALAHVLRNDFFAQNNLVQLGYHLFLKEVLELHANHTTVVSSACLALRQLASSERCKKMLLQCDFFQLCLKLIGLHKNSTDVVTNACGVIEALASTKSTDFVNVATGVSIGPLIFSCLQCHHESVDLCTYGFLIFHHISSQSCLLTSDLKLESVLRFMNDTFERHESCVHYQEAFCRCLSALLEASPQLHMFVDDTGIDKHDSTHIRVPLLDWIWVILLSHIQDTQHYHVFEAVCLAIYYLVVDSGRLRQCLLKKGAASAVFEGLRLFIGFSEPKFEKCLQYSCQALVALIMADAHNEKNILVKINAVFDLIDILENHVTAPDIAAEALAVIACLSDNDTFRKTACEQNIHVHILNLIQYKPTHTILVESAIEVLLILTQLDHTTHTVFNDAGIFREVIDILSRDICESITCKCLMLLHVLAEEEHISTYPKEGHHIAWILCHLLVPNQLDTLLTIEALVCVNSLCKSCSNIMPQLLVDCEIDINLFHILYNRPEVNVTFEQDSPDYVIYELAIDIIHSLSLNQECRQKMLLSAIKHSMIEAIKLLIHIGADVNLSHQQDSSDSPIYKAVLTRQKDVVECLLDIKITNQNLLKDALVLARELNLDQIVGLLLKTLGLDTERRVLNLGGLNLQEIKPAWIHPALGLKSVAQNGHRRHRSLEYVIDGLKHRQLLGETPDSLLVVRKGSLPEMHPSNNTKLPMSSSLPSVTDKGFTPKRCNAPRRKSSEYEDIYDLSSISLQAEPSSSLQCTPPPISSTRSKIPSRFIRSALKQRRANTASRPPSLPTVISSPESAVRINVIPDAVLEESMVSDFGDNLIGSVGISKMAVDFTDGDQSWFQKAEFEDHDLLQIHVPYRRHVDITKTVTGAQNVAFNSLDKFQRASLKQGGSFTSLVKTYETTHDIFSPKHIRRAALRSKKGKGHGKKGASLSGSHSQSSSPFHSSEEGVMIDSIYAGGSYNEFIASVTNTPKAKRSELLSSLMNSQEESKQVLEGTDETDSPMVHTLPVSTASGTTKFELLIHSLNLSGNKLRSLETLVNEGPAIAKKLRELLVMDAKQNCLTDLPLTLCEELTKLQSLLLSQNLFISLPLSISHCTNLVELDLSGNQISMLPLDTIVLPLLEKLNLSNNCLSSFPSILKGDYFPTLKVLLLDSNQIAQIDNKDSQLKNLQELYISKNSLKELPFAFLAGLTSLKVLDASRNSLELLPGESAEYLCSLQELKVGYNNLGANEPEFHSFVKTALVIQFVDGTDNNLMAIPPPYMWRSRGLKHLLLGKNKITSLDLSDCDRFWPHFERLVISENRMKEISPDIGKLRTLSCLDISHNRDIRHLPNEMGRLEYLFYLNLEGLKNLDIDRSQNARAVVHYLRSRLTQSKPCYVMKMTVVGGAGKGKTTLLRLLINEHQSSVKMDNTATLGVHIRKWIYNQRPGLQYIINCWDFAGQEEFYSTHQCFLTPRSIYILVYNLSKGESELDALVPWLLNIQARAPGSPVVVVGTHRDMISEELFSSVRKNMRQHINEIITKPGFPKDVTFAEISCIGQKVGLDTLRTKIKEKIDSAKLRGQKIMGEMVPASYLELCTIMEDEARRLNKTKSNFRVIRSEKLFELMSKNGLAQRMDRIEVEQAVQFLHECGILLHYDDIQSNLSDLYFLDPQWLCSMMAKVITVKQLTIVSKGILHVKDLPLLLKGSQFPQEFIPEYIRLLEWFDVALQCSSDMILIPSYLPKDKPEPLSLPHDYKIVRRYYMCFIPPGFWPRLVVRLLSFPRRAIHMTEPNEQIYWYSGLYIFWSLQAYFVIEQLVNSNNEFDITVPNTPDGIRLLCSVVDNVETLIDEWFPGLRNINVASGDPLVNPSALCPLCPAHNVHEFPMKDLQQLSITKDEVICPIHNGSVPLKLLSPDIIISDVSPKYHVSRDDIVMDENNPATVLGKGSFGEVLKAIYKGKAVALKIFSPRVAEMHNTTPNQLIRQEVSILSQLVHPTIIGFVGVCLRPKPMLLLEYAELGSLASFHPFSKISVNLKHRIALQVASALAFLHKNNVIYRDLKPGNILIFSLNFNAEVNAKLSDYGISTYATTTGLTQDIGTSGYKAPEILKAKTSKMPYDTKVDVYSYGIVLYQLITNGHAPFEELSPYERDKAVEEGRPIRNPAYYGCPPWPDMHEVILHCLQYIPSERPSAQEIFDRLCCPEFMALRHVIPLHQDWEVLSFTIRTYRFKNDRKHEELTTEAWTSSCDVGQQSMLSVVNLSQKSAQPQGRMMPQNTLVYSMVAVGTTLVVLGTNTGHLLVYEGYDKKEHRLPPLKDSILCLYHVRRRGEGKSYLFAGLANGMLAAYDQSVLLNSAAKPDQVIQLNNGPVKGMKRHHNNLYVISGLEVFVIVVSSLAIDLKWSACDDFTRKFLTCIEVDEDMVWTSLHNSPKIQAWDTEDGSYRRTIDIYSCMQTMLSDDPVMSSDIPDHYFSRVTALYLQSSSPTLLWVGIASGHLLIFDTATGHPLMITRRHVNAIRSIQSVKTTTHERPVNVVLTCGLGFSIRPGDHLPISGKLDRHGVLLLWDCSMPHVKPNFDEMKKQQEVYR